jgi:hypothetical protein
VPTDPQVFGFRDQDASPLFRSGNLDPGGLGRENGSASDSARFLRHRATVEPTPQKRPVTEERRVLRPSKVCALSARTGVQLWNYKKGTMCPQRPQL